MIKPHPEFSNSRRRFLARSSILTAAAAGIIRLPAVAAARPASTDQVEKIDLGVKPEMCSAGGVVVPMQRLVFLTFFGTLHDAGGADLGEGTAMIAFSGCPTWNFRCAGDEELAAHSVNIEELDFCECYEVLDSTWVQSWESAMGKVRPRLRHYIFTFLGFNPGVCSGAMNFECLAQDFLIDFFPTESFDEMLDSMAILDAAD